MSTLAVYAVLVALPDPQLIAHLVAWEKAAKDVTSVKANFTLTRTEPVWKKQRAYTGAVLYLRPGLTRLRLGADHDRQDYEAYISDGKRLYMYFGKDKFITEIPLAEPALPADAPEPATDLARWLFGRLIEVADPERSAALAPLVGVPAWVKNGRCRVTLFKEDANHVYFNILPLTSRNKQEFTQIRWALYGPKVKGHRPYSPAQAYVAHPNGGTEVWTFTDATYNAPSVTPDLFRFENVPGYTLRKAPPAVPKKP